jgi:ABC-type phosphate transport system substrate-binding protein
VKNLSKEQITDILSGKIKSWEPITGEKLPITILIPKNYVGSMKSLTQYYIKSDTSAAAQYVMNKDGLLSGMKNNRGAIGFFTNMETRADFSPKFFQLEVANVSALIMKKPARPAAQKLLDYLKAHPDLLANK